MIATFHTIGHRGASFDSPENTLAAVRAAWEQGADAVEVDVRLSRDGRLVVIHDGTTGRVGGPRRRVARQTFAQLRAFDVGRWKGPQFSGERIPSLEEVLATVPAGKRLFVEIKCGPEAVPALRQALGSAGEAAERTALIGFSRTTLAAAKRELPQVPAYLVARIDRRQMLARARKLFVPSRKAAVTSRQTKTEIIHVPRPTSKALCAPRSIDELITGALDEGFDGLDLGYCERIDADLVANVHSAGLAIYVWTVNCPVDAARLKAIGVDGIATDRPGWLRSRMAA